MREIKQIIPLEAIQDADAQVLNGLAVSPGVVTGKARVILKADTEEQVLAGEILVAPFTDPGWTPYFVPAAAIVMNQGGLLSQAVLSPASTVSLPWSMWARPPKSSRPAKAVRVDGNRGVVKVLR